MWCCPPASCNIRPSDKTPQPEDCVDWPPYKVARPASGRIEQTHWSRSGLDRSDAMLVLQEFLLPPKNLCGADAYRRGPRPPPRHNFLGEKPPGKRQKGGFFFFFFLSGFFFFRGCLGFFCILPPPPPP